MVAMKVSELDELIVNALAGSGHPEISKIERVAGASADHTRVVVYFANGTTAVIMVRKVEGPGVPAHADYQLPAGVI